MSPEQCRAARAWLSWSQDDLATKAQVSNSTVRDFEARRRMPIANNLTAIRRALEAGGIELVFADGQPTGIAGPVQNGIEEKRPPGEGTVPTARTRRASSVTRGP